MDQTKPKWIFIVNPIAGGGFARKYIPEIERKVKEYAVDADIVLTERNGHARELSREYAEKGYNYIIAVGGDGTFNELASSLVNNKNVAAGIVPAGTGNDFIQILGFPNRFQDSDWKALFSCSTIAMDVGYCNDRPFMNGMGLGFDATVAAKNYTAPDQRKKGGMAAYYWHIISTLFFYKEGRMLVRTPDGEHETDCFMNTVSIGRRFAGDFFITPKAIANDGLLDVCSIKSLKLLKRLKILMMVPKGTHLGDPSIHYFQTKELHLGFAQDVPYHLDGELFYGRNFEIKLNPGALNTLYNPNGKHYFTEDK